jgi:MATE family multidrug resistance protein
MPHIGQPPEVVAVLAPYWVAMAVMLVPFALLLVMKQFFDAVDRPWIGVGFSFLAVGINVPLNWVLIYGAAGLPGLGLMGAGIGSLLSETLAFLAALAYWRSAPTLRRMRVRALPSRGDMRATARLGAPLGLAYLGETGAYSLVGIMLGWFGAAALAAHQVVNAVGTVAYMLPLGMAAAVTIRIGQARGAGEVHRLGSIAIAALGTVLGWMLLMTVILALSAGTVASALADDPAVVAIATSMFLVVALMQVVDGLQSTAFGALRGLGDTAWPSTASVLTYWLVALPASYVAGFVLGWGPVAVWGGFGAGLAIAALALGWRLAALLRAGPVTSEPE